MYQAKMTQHELGFYEELFSDYRYYTSRIVKRKAELAIKEQDENVGGGRSSIVSNPTEATVLKEMSDFRLQFFYRLKQSVEATLNYFDKDIRKVIETRFFMNDGLNNWDDTATLCGWSRSQIYRVRYRILEVFANFMGFIDSLGLELC